MKISPSTIKGGNGLGRGSAVKPGNKSPGTARTPGNKTSPGAIPMKPHGHNGKGVGGPVGSAR